MFVQNSHPFYVNLLENDYTIKKSDNDFYFEWICGDLTLLISIRMGMLSIIDPKNDQSVVFPHLNIYGGNNYEGISEVIKEYTTIIKQSLNVKNIDVVNLVLYEIIKNYPNIRKISFFTHIRENKKTLEFIDQNQQYYKIIGQNIFDHIHNFCFVNDLQLNYYIRIEEISHHEIIKNFEKYKVLKKELLINPKIKKVN